VRSLDSRAFRAESGAAGGWSPQSAAEQEQAWADVGAALTQFEGDGGFTGPCKLLVAAGTR